jgi:hypothetical protein
VVNQTLVLRINICDKNRHLRQARKRYRKPYGDSANIKRTDMKRTFFDNTTERLTARPTSQRNEVLFFADPLFLFFNFLTASQNTLSFFYIPQPNPKKMKECFSHRFFKYLFIILYSCASI